MADHPGLRMLGQRVTITERDHPWFGYSGVVDKAVWFKMADRPEAMVEVELDNGMRSAVGVRGLSTTKEEKWTLGYEVGFAAGYKAALAALRTTKEGDDESD